MSNQCEIGEELEKWWADLRSRPELCAQFQNKKIADLIEWPEFEKVFQKFKNLFPNSAQDNKAQESLQKQRWGEVLVLLSYVKKLNSQKVVPQMVGPDPKKPLVSVHKFRQLLEMDFPDLYANMLVIIKLFKYQVNLRNLAFSLYYWGPKVKQKWAKDYFALINNHPK